MMDDWIWRGTIDFGGSVVAERRRILRKGPRTTRSAGKPRVTVSVDLDVTPGISCSRCYRATARVGTHQKLVTPY
jgi:hypothetical protein